jgi:hypothetical protein
MLLISQNGLKVRLPETTSPPEVRKTVEWGVQNQEGSTDYTQTYKGYHLAEITLNWDLSLDSGDVYKQLKAIEKVYSYLENGKPAIWKVIDPFLNSQGIKYVVAKDWNSREVTADAEVQATLVLMEYRPKEIQKEKKSSPTKKQQPAKHPCEEEKNMAKSECQRLYVQWRKEKEEALMKGQKNFPDFRTWLRDQPQSPATDDEAAG